MGDPNSLSPMGPPAMLLEDVRGLFDQLEERVQQMREEGEQDLRSVLSSIAELRP